MALAIESTRYELERPRAGARVSSFAETMQALPVCYTCGETYVGVTETACPYCGSTTVAEVVLPSLVGAD